MATTLRQVYELLSPAQRRQAAVLLGVMLIIALMQVGAVTSIMPFMAVVADPEILHRNARLASAYAWSGLDQQGFLVLLGTLVLTAVVVTNGFLALSAWLTTRFTCGVSAALSSELLRRYMARPYLWFVEKGSTDAGTNILSEVDEFVGAFLHPLLQLVAKGTTAFFLIFLVVMVDWRIALVASVVFGGSYAAVYFILRKRLAAMGRKRVEANQSRYKAVMEGFGAFKEVKAFERGEHFVRAYESPTRRFNRYLVACSLIKQMPRYFLETLAFGGLVALVLYFLAAGGDIRNMVPLLVLYAFAAYRLMPAVQVCFGCLTTLRFHHHLVGQLHQDFHAAGQAPLDQGENLEGWRGEKLSLERGIRFENVSFAYPGAQLPALREVSLTIPRRSMVAFCGATGSGKTTMVDLLLGLLPPSAGEIRVDGVLLTNENLPRWRRCVGYVPQEIFLSDDTLLRNIAFGVPDDEIDAAAVERAAKAARIHEFITGNLPEGYQTEVGERGIRLSGGQRQRLGIARALYHDPEVLIFDEATSALDGRTETEVMAAIQSAAKAKTVIMIAHRLTTVEACDRIFVVEEGRVVEQGAFGHLVDLNGTFRSLARSGRAIPAKEAS